MPITGCFQDDFNDAYDKDTEECRNSIDGSATMKRTAEVIKAYQQVNSKVDAFINKYRTDASFRIAIHKNNSWKKDLLDKMISQIEKEKLNPHPYFLSPEWNNKMDEILALTNRLEDEGAI